MVSCFSSRPRDSSSLMSTLVGVVHLDARDEGRALAEAAVAHHRVVHRQAVLRADDEVFLAMRGRGVHGAGAGLERHVIADDHRHVLLEERMLELQVLELLAGELRQHLALAQAIARQAGVEQFVGQHQHFRVPVARHPDRHVFDVRPQRHGLVGRQRPGRGGPDHQRHRDARRWHRSSRRCAARTPPDRRRGIPRRRRAKSCPRTPPRLRPARSGNPGTSRPAWRPYIGVRCG